MMNRERTAMIGGGGTAAKGGRRTLVGTTIPFTDVFINIQGLLFPQTPNECAHTLRKDTHPLEALLVHT